MTFLRLVSLSMGMLLLLASACSDSSGDELDGEVGVFDSGICFDETLPVEPPPEDARRCLHEGECDELEYCYRPRCKGEGWCMERPQVCPDIHLPVCGCDGFEHGNWCYAAARGVSTTTCSRCPACETNQDCEQDQFCNAFGDCSGPGTCGVRPEHCSDVFAPVCGCNGVTYGSECLAWAAGVRIAARGACECESSADCVEGEYCTGESCDAPGTCASIEAACATGSSRPICGCDGVTYASECAAAREGVRGDAYAACGTY